VDAAAVGVGERHPVGAAQQRAAGEHDEVASGAERPGGDLLQVRLRGGFHDDLGSCDQLVEREERHRRAERLEKGLAAGAIARGGGGEADTGQALVERLADAPADGAETDDADGERTIAGRDSTHLSTWGAPR